MLIKPLELGSQIQQRFDAVQALAEKTSPLQEQAKEALESMQREQTAEETLESLHRLQRLYTVQAMGLENEPKIVEAMNDPRFLTWKDYALLPAEEDKQHALAAALYEGDKERRTPVLLLVSDYGKGIAEIILERCVRENVEVDPWVDDLMLQRRVLHVVDEKKAFEFGNLTAEKYGNAERAVVTRVSAPSQGHVDDAVPKDINSIWFNQTMKRRDENSANQFYTLTLLPTPQDAELDQMPYDDYIGLFFAMCAVDWKEVDKAHKALIMKLNSGSILRFQNADGTDLTMDISGFTFANSLVAKNVPGSEVFSAPHRDSVNGRIVAKGRFVSVKDSSKLIENITLDFENGRVVNYAAEKGFDALQDAIETDEGSHYVGEIGIGTNPALQRHVINGLMVEKIGGSFHVALGQAYEYTEYLGEPVHLDNGNDSNLHWDITTMLVGKQGMMTLDGEVIIQDGKYVDPALSYLNGKPKP